MSFARSISKTLVASLALTGLAACAEPLPEEGLIITPRLLAIKTEVTTPLPGTMEDPTLPSRAQALPLETVTITPWIVGPDGPIDPAELDPVWIACELSPGAGLFGCISAEFPVALADIPACIEADFTQLSGGDLPETVTPCLIGRDFAPEYQVPLAGSVFAGGAIELTMVTGVGDGTPTDECANILFSGEYELPDDCIYAVQRLSVGPLEQLFVLLEQFGVEIDGVDIPEVDEVPEADRNPRITKLEYAILGEDGSEGARTEVNSGDTITAQLGQTIRVYTTSPEEDLQSYEIPVNNGASTQTETEAYFADWFRTWGTLLSGTSDDPESYNEWNLVQGSQDELESPDADTAHLYYVLRDGRQGVNWWYLRVAVDPAG